MSFGKVQYRHRQADLVIVIAFIFQGRIAAADYLGDHFFGRRFAHTPCNSDNFHIQLIAPETGRFLESGKAVLHQQADGEGKIFQLAF